MEKMSIFLACIIIAAFAEPTKAQHFSKVENIFQQNATIKSGDIMQCEITKSDIEVDETKNEFLFYTFESVNRDPTHFHQYVGLKCFSFKVAGGNNLIVLASSRYTYYIEVYFTQQNVAIRHTTLGVLKNLGKGVTIDSEFRGFWIKWSDDVLLEVGRENETIPFLYHRFSEKFVINYVGLKTINNAGYWKINIQPKCPGTNATEQQKKKKAESDCFILH